MDQYETDTDPFFLSLAVTVLEGSSKFGGRAGRGAGAWGGGALFAQLLGDLGVPPPTPVTPLRCCSRW